MRMEGREREEKRERNGCEEGEKKKRLNRQRRQG